MVYDVDSELQTKYTDLIVCPYCGYKDRDSWETDVEGESYCDSCGSEFFVSIHQSVAYSTSKIED